ncbi:NAD(P)H-binding protein [Lactiplantibacillus plantarum]|uniref:NAD(P)H-binding protein n=1 Tax=Lactiplantibacillus plantarum TaxID=1590 RepID=UPI000A20954E|nr:NAD(P)H-binding protein [Lactiplantibacillus plantarum]ARO07388.1 NAD(P)-dependent oxidoreductase [Lactiplantibacillus plantarum]MBP5817357.1 NAD(P)H-binding protein [Lactiplantibacillus plantarum]QAS26160.1 NAD-dependent epimerase/dehydratase family protein [Lactiplantibacillus plantarum]RWZ45227.1 NAD-dependent epimerase/dehydratase family protein [Lactiplantibacillus plantarum]WNJ65189.1 NAD(P)H-binding protein [Lactiplantibacillus plantarum]
MKKVLIVGATGTIGGAVRQTLLNETDNQLTLFARSANRLKTSERESVIAGDVTEDSDLDKAIAGQDVVFVALSGSLGRFAQKIVAAMDRNKVSRLLFITSMGIYDEIPASVGASGNLSSNPVLRIYREAADVVEASDLNYTLIRPGWFTGGPVDYEITKKGEPFGGHDVSINSIADFVKNAIVDNDYYAHDSVGLNAK